MFARGPEALDAKDKYDSYREMASIWRRTVMAMENAQHLQLFELARSTNRSPQEQLQLEELIATKLNVSSWAAQQLGRRLVLSTVSKGDLVAKAGTAGFVILVMHGGVELGDARLAALEAQGSAAAKQIVRLRTAGSVIGLDYLEDAQVSAPT